MGEELYMETCEGLAPEDGGYFGMQLVCRGHGDQKLHVVFHFVNN